MLKLFNTCIVLSVLLIAQVASAMEINPRDKFIDGKVSTALLEKVSNLRDPLCIQKIVLQSPRHQVYIATGKVLYELDFQGSCKFTNGDPCLIINGTYTNASLQTAETFYLGACELR